MQAERNGNTRLELAALIGAFGTEQLSVNEDGSLCPFVFASSRRPAGDRVCCEVEKINFLAVAVAGPMVQHGCELCTVHAAHAAHAYVASLPPAAC